MALPTKDIVTPLGNLNWVHITGEGKKDLKGEMKFEASLALDTGSEECETLRAIIVDFWDEYNTKNGKCKSLGIKDNTETNKTLFKFWTNTKFKDGSPNKVRIFSAGTPGAPPPEISLGSKRIGNESTGHISGTIAIYDVNAATRGCTLYLNSIQLIDFKPYTGSDPGFASHEGGYQGEQQELFEETSKPEEPEEKPRL